MNKFKWIGIAGTLMGILLMGSLMVAPAFAGGPQAKVEVCHYDAIEFDTDGTTVLLGTDMWEVISVNGHALEGHINPKNGNHPHSDGVDDDVLIGAFTATDCTDRNT